VNVRFLTVFNRFIRKQLRENKNWQFFIVVGGGKIARQYRDAGKSALGKELIPEVLDWLGIHATRLNAQLLRTIFRGEANPEIIKNPTVRMSSKKNIIVGSGWKPGWSTDYVATMMAREYGVKIIINLSNIDYVYDKDPRKYQDAKIKLQMTWPEFRKLVGNIWSPGLNAPFDPVAAKKSEELGLEVIIMNGQKMKNLENYLDGKKFKGTVIK